MADSIISISDRGQVTLPKGVREQVPVRHFTCRVKNGVIVLEPLQTREDFLEELESASEEWKEKGGLSIAQMRKKYNHSK